MSRRSDHSETTSHGLKPLPHPRVLQDQNALTRAYSATPPGGIDAMAAEPEPVFRPEPRVSDTDTLRAHDSDVMRALGGKGPSALEGDSTRTAVRSVPVVPVSRSSSSSLSLRPSRAPGRRLSATEHDGVVPVQVDVPKPMRRSTLIASVVAGITLPALIVVIMAWMWRPDPAAEQATKRAQAGAFHLDAASLALAQQRLPEVRVHLDAARHAGVANDAVQAALLARLEAKLLRSERLQALGMAVYGLQMQRSPEAAALAACQREAEALAAETELSSAEVLVLERLRSSIAGLQQYAR